MFVAVAGETMRDAELAHRTAQAFGKGRCHVGVGVRQDGEELLAAVAGEMGLDRQRAAHGARHALQAVVAGPMAIGVVKGLEVIDIGDKQHDAPGHLRALGPQPRQFHLGAATVGEPGQRVGDGEPRKVLVLP